MSNPASGARGPRGQRPSRRASQWRRRRQPRASDAPSADVSPAAPKGEAHATATSFWARYNDELTGYKRLFCGGVFPSDYRLVRGIFVRAMALIYGIAFLSFWVQLDPLIGSNGILPAVEYVEFLRERLGIVGVWTVPTLCWLFCNDTVLHGICAAGVVCSAMVALGVLPLPGLALLWFLYLSISSVARVFLGYQWDTLILEAGFVALLMSPASLTLRRGLAHSPSLLSIFLGRWLLFRLMFSSGLAKINSGDMTWRSLDALKYHYETQPIPNGFAWYAHQLPDWFQEFSVFSMFGIQLFLPFLIFTPRRLRLPAFAGLLGLQLLIIATGNYCFFNLIAVLLCLLLLDDQYIRWVFRWLKPPDITGKTTLAATGVALVAALIVIPVSYWQMKVRVFGMELGKMEARVVRWVSPYRTINGYGLFANMTENRPELIIEGSHDGREWQPYRFPYKVGVESRRPPFVAPHQPRLDWQMWFEALRAERKQKPSGWFQRFLMELLKGNATVTSLLSENPFSEAPPKYVRVRWFQYHFTTSEERNKSGNWWKKEEKGLYVKPSSLPKSGR